MTDLIHQLIEWVGQNPHWTGLFVFLLAFAESMAFVGVVVPGVVMMFAVGAMIGAGAVGFWPMYWLSVLGAVVGDGLSYWLGHHLRGRVADIWPFSRHPQGLERGVAFFAKYGGKSVAFGRFFGPVRAVIPMVAGMLSMSPMRFLVANVLSALVWAAAYLAPGVVFGASLELASEVAFRLVLVALVLVILLWFLGWLGHRLFLWFQPLASRIVRGLLAWGERSAWTGRIAAALADPEHPEARGLAVLAAMLVLAVALFTFTLTTLGVTTPLAGIDEAVYATLSGLRTPAADHVMVLITALGDAWLMGLLALTVFVLLLWTERRSAWYWLAAVVFALVAPGLLKYGLKIPRPHVAAGLSEWGFPSAHALRVTVLLGFLAVLGSSLLRPQLRWPVYWVVLVLVALVGFSRLYLGVHWLSDVMGGLLLGALWVAALGIAYRHHPHGYPQGGRLAAVIVLTLIAGMLVHGVYRHTGQMDRYEAPRDVVQAEEQVWLAGRVDLPMERDDLMERLHQPLNLQYAGDPVWLASVLEAGGWRPADRLGWANALKLLSLSLPLEKLPVVPQVHDGRNEALLMVKDQPAGTRLALRLWPTDVRIMPGDRPLWLGNIGVLGRRVSLDLFAYPSVERLLDEPDEVLDVVPGVAGRIMSHGPVRIIAP